MVVCGVRRAAGPVTDERVVDQLAGRQALLHAYSRFRRQFPTLPHRVGVRHRSNGAPYLEAAPELFCSVSHSHHVAVAVVSEQPVGIDIERVRAHHRGLLGRIASSAEIASLEGNDYGHAELVTLLWTLKEAAAKAAGGGVELILRGLPVRRVGKDFMVGEFNAVSYWEAPNFVALAFQHCAGQPPRICWHQPARLSAAAPSQDAERIETLAPASLGRRLSA